MIVIRLTFQILSAILCLLSTSDNTHKESQNDLPTTRSRRTRSTSKKRSRTHRQRRPALISQPDVLARTRSNGKNHHIRNPTRRMESPPRTPLQTRRRTRLYRVTKRRHGSIQKYSPRRPPHRSRSRLAIQPPRTSRPDLTPRPHPHPCQLVWAVARPRRHAQPQRLPHQSRR